jgi:hypothetical protein
MKKIYKVCCGFSSSVYKRINGNKIGQLRQVLIITAILSIIIPVPAITPDHNN